MKEEQVEKEQKTEAKYLINVGYFTFTQATKDGNFELTPKISQLLFNDYHKARKEYKELSRSKIFNNKTVVGEIGFSIFSIELVDINKYQSLLEQKEDNQDVEVGENEEEDGVY